MKRLDPQQRARNGIAGALARWGQEQSAQAARGTEPWPGDLFVLSETADLPVEWLLVERARQGRCLVAVVDDNPVLGCTDRAVPPEAPGGPLSVRCDAGLWIGAEALRRGKRTGSLAADDLDRVRRQLGERAAGRLADPRLGAAGEPDASYEEWRAEVLVPARQALSSAVLETAAPPRRSAPGAVWRASALTLLLALGAVSALTYRYHKEVRQERPSASVAAARSLLANVAYASFYPGASRGAERELAVPAGATALFLLVFVGHHPACEPYRLAVTARDSGATAWSAPGLLPLPSQEVSVVVPRGRMPDGVYLLRLSGSCGGKPQDLDEYELRLRSQQVPTAAH